MIKLKYIAFEITDSCNLDCVYCYNIWKSDKVKRVPFNSYSKAIKTIEKLFSIAEIEYITFTGGEPFLAERFNEVVLYCIMAGKKVSIISNGTQANQQKYKELIKLGVELFEFPIHSLKPEIHDKMVQLNGSWEKSTASIKTVQELGGKVVPVIVITKHNVNQIAETLDFIASLGCNRIMLNRYNIGGNGCENPLEVSATAEELRHAFYIANEKANELNLKITANVCTPICLLNPSDYPSIGFGHCSFNVLERPITIDINGNIRLCNHSPIVAGNIYETELSKILYSEYTTEWETSIPEFCKPCSQWSTCKGGCRAATEQCKGRLDIEDPIIKALNINSIFKEDNEDTFEIVWQKGFCGFKNSKGEMFTPCKYDYVEKFSDDAAMVSINGKYGFINKNGIEIIPLIYDFAYSFSEGLAPVKQHGKYGYIDKKSNEIIPFIYDKAISFSEGLGLVAINGKYGFIDCKGNVVISLKYKYAASFKEGFAAIKEGYSANLIDKEGKILKNCRYNTIWPFNNGLAKIMRSRTIYWHREAELIYESGYINKKGELLVTYDWDGEDSFSEGLAVVFKQRISSKSYGYINENLKEQIRLRYEKADSFKEGLAPVKLDGKYGYIDKKENIIIPFIYSEASVFCDGLAVVKLNQEYGFIDKTGKTIINFIFERAESFRNGLAAVKMNGKYGFIDKHNEIIIPFIYDHCFHNFHRDLVMVKLDGKYGKINNKGIVVLPIIYDEISPFIYDDYFQCKLDGKTVFLDRNGNELFANPMSE